MRDQNIFILGQTECLTKALSFPFKHFHQKQSNKNEDLDLSTIDKIISSPLDSGDKKRECPEGSISSCHFPVPKWQRKVFGAKQHC